MKRCIIYARIGGSASEVNNSLMQAQLAWLRAAAKCLGLEVVAELPVLSMAMMGTGKASRHWLEIGGMAFTNVCW